MLGAALSSVQPALVPSSLPPVLPWAHPRGMPFFLSLLLWPVRKAALLPAAVLGGVAVGAAFGSYDLSRRAACSFIALPSDIEARPGTQAFSLFTSLSFTTLLVAAREALFAPAPVPAPLLPLESGPILQRLRNAAALVRHHTIHYPLRFRFATAFVAGCVGGISYPVSIAYYNIGYRLKFKQQAAQQAAEEQLLEEKAQQQ